MKKLDTPQHRQLRPVINKRVACLVPSSKSLTDKTPISQQTQNERVSTLEQRISENGYPKALEHDF